MNRRRMKERAELPDDTRPREGMGYAQRRHNGKGRDGQDNTTWGAVNGGFVMK